MSDLFIVCALIILKLKAIMFIFKRRKCSCQEKRIRFEKAIKKIIENELKK